MNASPELHSPTLLLTEHDVRTLLPMPECIDVMQDALSTLTAGHSMLPLRTVIRMPGTTNALATMPAVHGRGDGASLGAKIITVFPGNHATGRDSHLGVVLLFDASNGSLLAIADASSITAIRTAAVSGLATRLLANEEASELALLGAGALALPHLDAVRAVRPIRHVRIWSRSGAKAEAFAARVHAARAAGVHDITVTVCDGAREAVRGAHVVCTITSARQPVLEGAWLEPGMHVNAVGASVPDARELDSDAMARARLYVDRRESTLAESGDFLVPKSEGVVTDAHILGELGELLAGIAAGRSASGQITLFKSLGLAVEDVAALRYLYERARATGSGTPVVLGGARPAD